MSWKGDQETGLDGAADDSAAPASGSDLARARRRTASAERRRASKLARAAIPPPTRDQVYDGCTFVELRAMRQLLMEEETRVSYWRRVMQARLDIARAGRREMNPADLSGVLTDARSAVSRLAHIDVHPVDDLEPLPNLSELWSRQVTPAEPLKVQALINDLEAAEAQLSAHRADVHRRIDLVTAELIARYREQPALALLLLPTHPSHLPSQHPTTGQGR